jgi:hypothetical protein
MDRPFGEMIATIIGGMLTIFTVAATLLRLLRKHQLKQVNQQLDQILADGIENKDSIRESSRSK